MSRVWQLFKAELFRICLGGAIFAAALVTELLSADDAEHGLYIASLALYILALLVTGIPVFISAVRGVIRGDFLDEKFLMCIASVGAMIIGEASEGVAVMLFFLVGEYFEHRAVARSRKSIRSLMDIRPDEATLLVDGEEVRVDADEVTVGALVIIRAGERVPVDCEVTSGTADIDTSSLTGEAVPRAATVGTRVESGSVVLNGVITARVLRLADESAAARVLDLVENANENKAKEESFITKFSKIYTPTVVGLAIIMAILPPLFIENLTFSDSIYRALSFLVISCPCALVISVPMAFFGGIGGAASKGILFKGGNVFAPLARADSFAFDKTGTLTTGELTVAEIRPYGITDEQLLQLAASCEYGSNHPLARCVKDYVGTSEPPSDYLEIAGKGVVATVRNSRTLVGNSSLLSDDGITVPTNDLGAALFVASDGVYKGCIFVKDTIKTEAENSIKALKSLGVRRCAMLSGDRHESALSVGRAVGIDEVCAELLPEQKYEALEQIKADSRATVYVGDGINDAPALAIADVGVAMGAIGSDSAIEAADVVVMSDSLERLPTAVRIARKTLGIAKVNIGFAIGVKLLILLLSALGITNMWLAVFADVGVAVIAILNSLRAMRC